MFLSLISIADDQFLKERFIAAGILVHLLSITTSLRKSSPTTCGLAEHDIAAPAQYDTLGMTENGRNLEASGAFNIHKETIGTLDKAFELVSPSL